MSDPRIDKLSNMILGSAIDEWNGVLAASAGKPPSLNAALELVQLAAELFPELYESQNEIPPEASGKRGLLAWVQWFFSKQSQLRLSSECAQVLRGSLARAISLLSTSGSVQTAIEAASRRQVYELAYGLTHEINNPLGNIVARAQQLLTKSNDPYERKSLATVVDQGMRAHEMLAELMRAVQPRSVEVGKVELVSLAKEALENALPFAKAKDISMRLVHGPSELWIDADRVGLLEAMRLICQNAVDACRENDSILWTIEDDGAEIMLSIEDTGPGLSSTARARAFDLFYSGREAGRGLGVSLAVVSRLVSESGGSISLSSQTRLGCRVEMRFLKTDTCGHNPGPSVRKGPWKI